MKARPQQGAEARVRPILAIAGGHPVEEVAGSMAPQSQLQDAGTWGALLHRLAQDPDQAPQEAWQADAVMVLISLVWE